MESKAVPKANNYHSKNQLQSQLDNELQFISAQYLSNFYTDIQSKLFLLLK